jgi:hypothetical protein
MDEVQHPSNPEYFMGLNILNVRGSEQWAPSPELSHGILFFPEISLVILIKFRQFVILIVSKKT